MSTISNATITAFLAILTALGVGGGGTSQLAAISGAGSGLVAHYTFDGDSNDTAGGLSGAVSSGSYVAGKIGQAIDVSSGNVSFGDLASVEGKSALTISLWVKFPTASGVVGFLSKFADTTNQTLSMSRTWPSWNQQDGFCGFLYMSDELGYTACGGTNLLANTNWNNLAMVYNGSNIIVYVNGTQVGSASATGVTKDSFPNLLLANAAFDDFRIYSRALSSSEITEIYNYTGSGGSTPTNGVCGSSNNICSSGSLSDTADTSTLYQWQCLGSGGGTTASCSLAIPAQSDTQAPSTPTSLSATAISSSQINLSWTASTDNVGVTGYRVYRNGTLLASPTSNSYSNTGLSASTNYSYTVSAYDAAGNTSSQSSSANATTQSASVSTYTLSITKIGSGSGTVTGSSISCGSTCTQSSISSGTSITLTATPQSGSTFTGWSGGGCSGTGTCTTSITVNTTVTATFASSVVAGTCSSISQYGITWTFASSVNCGQFANGDWWVIGPVTLTGISPASVVTNSVAVTGMTAHGSMINPIASWWTAQGLDSRIGNYVESLNIARQGGAPLSPSNTRVVPTGSSIASATSRLTAGGGEHALLNDFAVLTVLASEPASGSFRPPYIGTDKTIKWNKSQLNYSILKNLPPASGMNPPTSASFTRPWVHISTQYNAARDYSPVNNQVEYDRDISWAIGAALLELHQNYTNAEKELAYVRMVQYGIDLYGAMKYGSDVTNGTSYPLVHENTGPKAAAVLAALALNDSDMKYYVDGSVKVTQGQLWGPPYTTPRWGIDNAANYVLPIHVGQPVNDQYLSEGRPRYTYTAQMVGLPEWEVDETSNLGTGGSSGWDKIYRNVRYTGIISGALAMHLTTGARAVWNHQAYFDYFDRAFVTYTHSGNDSTWPPYVIPWWNSYRSLDGAVWPQAAPVSGIGWIPVAGNVLNINYTDNVTTGSGGNSGLTVNASGGPVTATYVSGTDTNRKYNLSRVIGSTENVVYTYTQPGNGVEASYNGLDVITATNISVVNYSTQASGSGGGITDTTLPIVSITSPAGGTVSGSSVSLSATASDNIGVIGVQFRLDGANLGAELSTAPYSGTWNTTGVSNGTHTLTAVARDLAGNITTSSSVTVTVNNTVVTPTPTNGLCSTTQNICTTGTLQDTTDSATNYLWNCLGSNGGINASCSLIKPVVITPTPTNGLCGSTQNICTQGAFSDVTDSTSSYLWQCLGSNGGTNTSCSLSIPTTPTTPTTPAPSTGTFTPTVTQKPVSSGGGGGGSSSTRPTTGTTVTSSSTSQLAQLIELFISLGIIKPDKVSAARAFIASSQNTITTTSTGTKFTLALDLGSKNTEVTTLQTYLIYQKLLSTTATGYFGPATAKAVGLFQQKYNLSTPGSSSYGFVGPKTRAKLNELVK